jgi:ferredoxin
MVLFKEVKKPVLKGAAAGGGDVSPLRPRYVEKTPPCAAHCPNHSQVREWLTLIAQHEAYQRTPGQAFELAWRKVTEVNPFPASGARVCQHACEQSCNRKGKDGAVAIHLVERYLGDYAIAHGWKLAKTDGPAREAVAVVGAGPAGLSCAYQLARRGYSVTVFDAAPQPGGMMRYGVPRRVIPGEVLDAEIANVTALGVQLRCNCIVGRDATLDDIRRDYAAVFFAIGLQKPSQLAPTRDGGGAVVAGALPADFPAGPYLEADQFEARVANAVCPAVAQGRQVAEAIDALLRGRPLEAKVTPPVVKAEAMKLDWYPAAPPHAEVSPAIQLGLTEAEVVAEAKRCMSCGLCMDCETCWMYCTNNCFVKLPKGEHYKIKLELCNGCKKCADACPCGYIELH